MNLNKIKTILPFAALLLSMGLSSCTNDLNVTPIDPRKNTTVDAQRLFNKCYAEFVLEGNGPGDKELDFPDAGLSVLYRLVWNANDLTTDEALCGWSDNGIAEFVSGNFTPNNQSLYAMYWRLCFGISICNQYLKECSDYDATMTAEVHFLRDLYYYFMLDNFGNPSYAEEVSSENPQQISSAELFQKITEDLEANMGQMLPPSVRKNGQQNYGRADQSAAWMLLARLYLNAEKYTGTAQWAKARDYAAKVINESGRSIWMGDNTTTHRSANGKYSAYQMLFMADNDLTGAYNESIFAFVQDGGSTAGWGGSLFLHAASWDANMAAVYPQKTDQAWGGNRTRKDLIEKFISLSDFDALPNWKAETIIAGAGDDRALLYGDNAKGDGGTKDRKYTNDKLAEFTEGIATIKHTCQRSDDGSTSNTTFTDNDIMLMRLAEAYLIYAEAEARADGSTTTKATGTGYINQLHERANCSSKNKGAYTLDEILDERARELYFEGVRRTDLIRYGYFGGSTSYTWQWKGGIQSGGQLEAYKNIYPIPSTELGANPNLKQNPGY